MGWLEKLLPPASRKSFARKALKAFQSAGQDRGYVIDDDKFELRLSEHSWLNLANLYSDYARTAFFHRKKVLDRVVELARQSADDSELDFNLHRDAILPRLKPLSHFHLVALQLGSDSVPWVSCHTPISQDLGFEYVIDTPSSCLTLAQKQLDELGKRPEELWTLARDNLYAQSVKDYVEIQPGLYVSPFQDSHDASRLLLPDLLRDLKVKGRIVAAPVRPHLVFFCGSEDADGLLKIAEITFTEMELGGRTVTGDLIELVDDRWQRLILPSTHPAFWPARRNHLVDWCGAYNDEKGLLETIHRKTGRDCHVATLSLMGYKDSPTVWTWCVWIQGVTDALLPRSDVVLFDDGRSVRASLWNHVRTALGHLMERVGDAMPRYHVTGFPTEAELQAAHCCPRDEIRPVVETNAAALDHPLP